MTLQTRRRINPVVRARPRCPAWAGAPPAAAKFHTSPLATTLSHVAEPTRDDVDAIVGPATPHSTYQLRARALALAADLPVTPPVRRYAEEKAELLDRLGYASSKAEEGPREAPARPGGGTIPRAAPAGGAL